MKARLITTLLCTASLALSAQTVPMPFLSVAITDSVNIDLVWVDGGQFTMGCNNAPRGVKDTYEANAPEHSVEVQGFYMGRFEVTRGQWRALMGEPPSAFSGSDSLPVESCTWDEAQEFVMLLSMRTGRRFRLPTEAEWEYAARGGQHHAATPYSGADRSQLGQVAWFCANSKGHPHIVGLLSPNTLGLYDMSGNVAEWCADWMAPYTAEHQIAPRGARNGECRIIRGGHYNSTSPAVTVYDRSWYVPSGRLEYVGLRVVMDSDGPTP
ncbi:MAG: SUMF1/EgtB/PvdO family nonheme iron enzyme [Bacteroidales bacterium]|nr:SUMF1/EgtB/PvdO family nonheme iron enzyme [Bacteroidales bacterium]